MKVLFRYFMSQFRRVGEIRHKRRSLNQMTASLDLWVSSAAKLSGEIRRNTISNIISEEWRKRAKRRPNEALISSLMIAVVSRFERSLCSPNIAFWLRQKSISGNDFADEWTTARLIWVRESPNDTFGHQLYTSLINKFIFFNENNWNTRQSIVSAKGR